MRKLAVALLVLMLAVGVSALAAPDDPLPSWKAGPVKAQLVEFVRRVTTVGGADHVPPGERKLLQLLDATHAFTTP